MLEITKDAETGHTIKLETPYGATAVFNAPPSSGEIGARAINEASYAAACFMWGRDVAEEAFSSMDAKIATEGGLK